MTTPGIRTLARDCHTSVSIAVDATCSVRKRGSNCSASFCAFLVLSAVSQNTYPKDTTYDGTTKRGNNGLKLSPSSFMYPTYRRGESLQMSSSALAPELFILSRCGGWNGVDDGSRARRALREQWRLSVLPLQETRRETTLPVT